MKKNLLFIMLIAVISVISHSCTKDYLDTQPTDAILSDVAVSTTGNGWASLNGIHRMLYMQWANQGEGGQGSMMINVDYMGEDIAMHAAGTGWFNATHQWIAHRTPTGATALYPWRMYYRIIANANLLINNIQAAEGPQSEKDHIMGQALAYRAWAHFNMVQLYAIRYDWNNIPNNQPGVPVMLTNTTEPQPRATVEDVYTQINLDLDRAIVLLTGKPGRAKSHISVNVARGIKARVALTQGNWTEAIDQSRLARTAPFATLMSHAQIQEGFSSHTNPEFMWTSEVIAEHTSFFFSFYAYMSFNFSSTMNRTNPKKINNLLYATMPPYTPPAGPGDVRRTLWEPTLAVARTRLTAAGVPGTFVTTTHHNFKFRAVAVGDSRGDVPYMRTAEMFLIEAEALARRGLAGDDALARIALTRLVSARRTPYDISALSGAALIAEIMIQRRIELWGEGFRFFDLKRLNEPLNRNGMNHSAALAVIFDVPAGDPRWQWLIPQSEIDANPLMVQNP